MNARPCVPAFPNSRQWLPATTILGGLTLWEIAAQLGWISPLFFPPPSLVLLTLAKMALSGEMWVALGLSLYRLTLGLVIGGGSGLLLGWVMGANRIIRIALDPIVASFHPLPKLAIYPIFLVLLGIGETSTIALVALTALFPILINTLAGVRQIDRSYWEVATNYGASGGRMLRRVIIPGSLPMALTGLRLAMNQALIVTVAVEMLSAKQGLGAALWLTWQTMRIREMYAILVVIACFGQFSNIMLKYLEKCLLPWRGKDETHEGQVL